MKRKTKVKILRLFHNESGAHIRARLKREMRRAGRDAIVSNWFMQAHDKL